MQEQNQGLLLFVFLFVVKETGGESDKLTNGLLFYSQRLQMYLNKGISSFNYKIDTDGIRITFRCIHKDHPKRRYFVVLKVNDDEKWECK